MAFKKYPCCACSHAAIEAALSLVAEHGLAATDIELVIVRISPDMDRLVGERAVAGADPEVAAQFSVRHAVSCALHFGKFSVEHLQPACLSDTALAAFSKRVVVEVDPALPGKFAPAEVKVKRVNTISLRRRIDAIPGTPAAPIDHASHTRKIDACFASGAQALDPLRLQLIKARISQLDKLADMRHFFDGVLTA